MNGVKGRFEFPEPERGCTLSVPPAAARRSLASQPGTWYATGTARPRWRQLIQLLTRRRGARIVRVTIHPQPASFTTADLAAHTQREALRRTGRPR